MSIRLRKFIGAVALLTFVIIYTLIAMALGAVIVNAHTKTVQFVYYVVAGLLWTLPAFGIIRWSSRPS
ncbi:MAG: DUF2842 domain-containing protein [Pseudomonadota bacterium]